MAEAVPFQLPLTDALRKIRAIAADTKNIVILNHARDRQKERGITRRQIERCIQMGTICEGPAMNQHGNWQVNLHRHAAGEELTCVVAIDWPNRLLVITAF